MGEAGGIKFLLGGPLAVHKIELDDAKFLGRLAPGEVIADRFIAVKAHGGVAPVRRSAAPTVGAVRLEIPTDARAVGPAVNVISLAAEDQVANVVEDLIGVVGIAHGVDDQFVDAVPIHIDDGQLAHLNHRVEKLVVPVVERSQVVNAICFIVKDGGEGSLPVQHFFHPGVEGVRQVDRGPGGRDVGAGIGIGIVVRRFSRHRVGEQAHRRQNRRDDADHHDPQGGAAVAQHVFDAALGVPLVEGQGAGGGHPPVGGQGQQGGGVVGLDLRAQPADDGLVAGGLDVPAHEDVRRPHRGVEPVEGQGHPANRLDNVIQAAQMGPLMAEDELPGLARQPGGQIDPGTDKAQDEGGVHGGVLPGAVLGTDGVKQTAAQPEIGEQRVERQGGRARQPHPGQQGLPGGGGRGLGLRSRGGHALGDGEGRGGGIVGHGGDRAICGLVWGDILRGVLGLDRGDRLSRPGGLIRKVDLLFLPGQGVGDDGQRALQRHRDQQPGEHHQPQQAQHLPGGPLFQQQPEDHDHGGGIGGGDAHLPQGGERLEQGVQKVKHGDPPLCSGR